MSDEIKKLIEILSEINEDVDFANDYFQFSGLGKTRLRRVLKYKLGFLERNNLETEDLDFV